MVKKLEENRQENRRKVFWGKSFPRGSAGKESACNAGDLGSIPGLGRAPKEGKSYSLQYSGLENPMDSMGGKESDMIKQLSLSFSLWGKCMWMDILK